MEETKGTACDLIDALCHKHEKPTCSFRDDTNPENNCRISQLWTCPDDAETIMRCHEYRCADRTHCRMLFQKGAQYTIDAAKSACKSMGFLLD